MNAAIVSDVVPIKGADRQPPPNNTTKAEVIMASIQGEDHERLALLLDVRVKHLEKLVGDSGKLAQAAKSEVDVVSGKLDAVLDSLSALATRFDAHIDSLSALATRFDAHIDGEKTPVTIVGLIAKHPWLVPVTLILGAIAFGGTAFLDFVGR